MRSFAARAALLLIVLTACGKDDPTEPEIGPVAQMEIIGGNGQEAEVATELPEALAVRLTDASGAPVSGQQVTFSVTSGGGSLFVPTAQTDASGEARNRWTLGTSTSEAHTVEARVVDSQTGEAFLATFTATAVAGSPTILEKISGDAQTAPLGAMLPDSVVVQVKDAYENPTQGVEVAWTVTEGGGTTDAATTTTDADGRTFVAWTLGSVPSPAQVVVATVEGLPPVSFSATATIPDAELEIVSGDAQVDTVAATLSASLVVRLTLEDGTPVPGASVTWEIESGEGAVSPTGAETNPEGTASTSWTLGTMAGEQTLLAVAEDDTVRFTATAQPGALASLTVAPDQVSFSALKESLELSLTGADQFGNAVEPAGPSWTSRNTSVASVDAAGKVTAEANGTSWIIAAAGSASDSARVEVSQVPASVTVSPGSASLWVGESQTFTASVRDANGFAMAGAAVAWTSSDPTKAAVNASGQVTAEDGGDGISIRASISGVDGSASLMVIDPVWEAVAPMPQAVRAGAAASDGSRIFMLGGSPRGDEGSTWNQRYDASQDSWTLRADLSSSRQFAMAGGLSDGVHLVGGVTSPADIHEVYSPGSDSWTSESDLPAERWASMSAVAGGKLYVIGGRSPSGATTQVADVFIYDPQTDSWETGAPMPTPRMSAAIGVLGGKIYVAGGQTTGLGTTEAVEVYDPATDSWSMLAPMPEAREALGGGAFYGRFCVFGGRTTQGSPTGDAFPDTWCYNAATDSWHDGPDMLTPRVETGSASVGGFLYSLGGRTPSEIAVATVERLRPF